MESFPAPSEKNVPLTPPVDTELEVHPALPMQCWADERSIAPTEMVVYFATGDLSPNWPRLPISQLCKGGAAQPLKIQEGTFISLGADPDVPHSMAQNASYPQN